MSQLPKNQGLALPHRYTSYDPKQPDLTNAYDNTVVMSERAQSAIHLVQNELIGDRTLEDSVLFAALDTVRLELQDIDTLLRHFVESQSKRQA